MISELFVSCCEVDKVPLPLRRNGLRESPTELRFVLVDSRVSSRAHPCLVLYTRGISLDIAATRGFVFLLHLHPTNALRRSEYARDCFPLVIGVSLLNTLINHVSW